MAKLQKSKPAPAPKLTIEDEVPDAGSVEPAKPAKRGPATGKVPTTETRKYLALGVPGRDGKGPAMVTEQVIQMPNGERAKPGDTFDPVVEGMSLARFQQMLEGKLISADSGTQEKLLKHWETKSSDGKGC